MLTFAHSELNYLFISLIENRTILLKHKWYSADRDRALVEVVCVETCSIVVVCVSFHTQSRRKPRLQQQRQSAMPRSSPRTNPATRMTHRQSVSNSCSSSLASADSSVSAACCLPAARERMLLDDPLQLLLKPIRCSISSATIRSCLRRRPSPSPLLLARKRARSFPPRRLQPHRTSIPAVSLSSPPFSSLLLTALSACLPRMRWLTRPSDACKGKREWKCRRLSV